MNSKKPKQKGGDVSGESGTKMIERISALDIRVTKLETYWYVTLALAAILGIGGGWIGVRLSELEAKSRTLLESVDKAQKDAVSAVNSAKESAIASIAPVVKAQADQFVGESLAGRIKAGQTLVGGLNGHDGRWLDVVIPFTGKDGKPFTFAKVPRVIVSTDYGQTDPSLYVWAVTVLSISNKNFTIRVRSLDQSHEGNPGWNKSPAVQWIAYAED